MLAADALEESFSRTESRAGRALRRRQAFKSIPMLIVGTEWLVDASNCDPEALRDVGRLRAVFERAVAELDLRVVGQPLWHKFPEPGGVTGLALLSESHLACHTYPEFATATFNLYCCRARPRWNWEEVLRETLGATRVVVHVVERRAEFAHADGGDGDDEGDAHAASGGAGGRVASTGGVD